MKNIRAMLDGGRNAWMGYPQTELFERSQSGNYTLGSILPHPVQMAVWAAGNAVPLAGRK